MGEGIPLQELAGLGAAAVLAALLLHRLRFPPIAGLLVAGAIGGPHGLGLVDDTEDLEAVAEIGVILLLFVIGVEFSLSRLRFIWRTVALGGTLQMTLTGAAAIAILAAFGETAERSIIFGAAVALSSTAIVLQAVAERGELSAPHGRLTVGILLFQDLMLVPLTLLVPILTEGGDIGADVGFAIIQALAVVVTVALLARRLMPRLFAGAAATGSREVFMLTVLSVVLGASWLVSELGFSLALGAFLAGLLLSETEYRHRAMTDVFPLRSVFVSIFFISLGTLVDTDVFIDEPVVAPLIVAGLVLGKGAIAAVTALLMRYPARAAWLTGVYVAQFGEFGFILLTLSEAEGIVTGDETRLLVTTGVVSMLLSQVAMEWAARFRAGEAALRPLERLLRAREVDDGDFDIPALRDHVVIVGYGLAGRLLSRALAATRIPYVIVELDIDRVRQARDAGEPANYGDITSPETMEHARLREARSIAILINDPDAARRAIVAARSFGSRDLAIWARTHYVADREELLSLGATEVICEEYEAGKEMTEGVVRSLGVDVSSTPIVPEPADAADPA